MARHAGQTDAYQFYNMLTGPDLFEAVSQIFENLERDICGRCTARIFRECKRVPRRTEGVVPIEP